MGQVIVSECVRRSVVVGLLVLALMLLGIQETYPQSQTVIVKTRGRMIDDGSIIKGVPLSESIITIQGNMTYESNERGVVAIPTLESHFVITNVTRQGYRLNDGDILHHSHSYSAHNPFYIIMDTYDQQLSSRLLSEQRIRKSLMRQLKKNEQDIEQMRYNESISEQEYKSQIEALHKGRQTCELLIKNISEEYASIDFDQLDEFDRDVYKLIIDGELQAADSLVNSKGDIDVGIKELERLHDISLNAHNKLKHSEEFEAQRVHDIAERCYYKQRIHSMRIQHDSALYYLALRADLDTLNFRWQMEVGEYCHLYIPDYNKSISYYNKAKNVIIQKYGRDHVSLIEIYNSIGMVYLDKGDYEAALDALLEAHKLQQQLYEDNHLSAAATHYNMGNLYANMGLLEKAKDEYFNAIVIYESNLGPNSYEVANVYDSIGVVYQRQEKYDLALDNFTKALEIYSIEDSKHYHDLAVLYNNIASLFCNIAEYEKSYEYYAKALDVYKRLYDDKHPEFAITHFNIGRVHALCGEFEQAEKKYNNALNLLNSESDHPHPYISVIYNGFGDLYRMSGDLDNALKYYLIALDIGERSYDNKINKAHTYNNIADVYHSRNMCEEALRYYSEALELNKQYMGEYSPASGRSYVSIGHVCALNGQYDLAMKNYKQAESVFLKSVGPNSPLLSKLYGYQGDSYRMDNQTDKALGCYLSALAISLDPQNVDHLQASRLYLSIGIMYLEQKLPQQAISYLSTSLKYVDSCQEEGAMIKISVIGSLGKAYFALGEYSNALNKYISALNLCRKVSGIDDKFLCNLYSNTGLTYTKLNNTRSAAEYYRMAIDLIEQRGIDDRILVATIYHNMADILAMNKEYGEAAEMYRVALGEFISLNGAEHLDTATIYRNLGYVYIYLNDFESALCYLDRSRAIRESLLEACDMSVIDVIEQYGRLYCTKGDYALSLEYYNDALKRYNLSKNGTSVKAGMLYSSIGYVYYLAKDRSKAIKNLKRAREILLIHYLEDHPVIQNIDQNILNLK